jgi:hypothetical protein
MHVSRVQETRNAYQHDEKHKMKGPNGRIMRRCRDNIEIGVRKNMWCGLQSDIFSWFRTGLSEGFK